MKLKKVIRNIKNYSKELNELEHKAVESLDLSISSIYNSFESQWTKNDLKLYYDKDYYVAEKLYKEYMELDQKYEEAIDVITDWEFAFSKVMDGYNEFEPHRIKDGVILVEMLIEQDIDGGDT